MRLLKKIVAGLVAVLAASAGLAGFSALASAQEPGPTAETAVPLCDAGGVVEFDVAASPEGAQQWVSVVVPPDMTLTADVVNSRDEPINFSSQWRFKIDAHLVGDDGEIVAFHNRRTTSVAERWGSSDGFVPVGEFRQADEQNLVIANSLDGGEFLVSVELTDKLRSATAGWRLEDFRFNSTDGSFGVDACDADALAALPMPDPIFLADRFDEARSLCDAGGNIEFDVNAGVEGDERWVHVFVPANSQVTVDVIHSKNVNRSGNWNNVVQSYRRNEDGSPAETRHGRVSSTAPFYWGTSSRFIEGAPLGDNVGRNNVLLIGTGDVGGFFLIEAEHTFEHGTGSPTSRWRVDDFTLTVDGEQRPTEDLCSGSPDGFENESGEPLNRLPEPADVGVHFPAIGYDDQGEHNNEFFPVCVVSAEYRQGPCFVDEETAFAYLEEQVTAEGRHGHVWVGGFDEPLIAH